MTDVNLEDLRTSLGLIPHPEGGYFLETYRSGSIPMTTKGQTDFNVPSRLQSNRLALRSHGQKKQARNEHSFESLTAAFGREHCRPDGDIRRNCLTSIIWMPTFEQPLLFMARNMSDHVHYYQGGCGFEYFMYSPAKGELKHEILGPDIKSGHKLQISCPGGIWKCGKLLQNNENDYCIIGEAVAPGFDFHDFSWITEAQVMEVSDVNHRLFLLNFVHKGLEKYSGKEAIYAEQFYN